MDYGSGVQGTPADARDDIGGCEASYSSSEVDFLADTARQLEADTPWYETLGLQVEDYRETDGLVAVESVVASSVSNGALHANNANILIPVLERFKSLITSVQGASSVLEEVREIVQYCAGVTRYLLEAGRLKVMPPEVVMAGGELKAEIESVCTFVEAHDTHKTCCDKVTLSALNRASAEKHKRKLRHLLDSMRRRLEAKADASETRRLLTFVSHAGEEKPFVRSLLEVIEQANVPAFFDDDMALGTSSEEEMTTRAAQADKAIVVLSRSFLTKKWPMKELHIFLEKKCKIYPLYYNVTPDEIKRVVATYDRRAEDDKSAFVLKMKSNPSAWRKLMGEIGGAARHAQSGLPDPLVWREDISKLMPLTGLRRKDFTSDEPYKEAIARLVSPLRLPDVLPPLPDYFVRPPLVDDVISGLLSTVSGREPSHIVVTGMGGAGKSLVASAVARDRMIRRSFTDGVLWLNDEHSDFSEERLLSQLNILREQFQKLVLTRHIRQGRTSQYNAPSFETLKDAQEYFAMWQKKFDLRCLFIVDGTWNVEVLETAGMMGFHVLATTRKEDAMPATTRWRSLSVRPMTENDSLLMLKKRSGASDSLPQQPASQVARDCAYLPLALSIAGSTPTVVDSPLSGEAWRELHEKLKDKTGTPRRGAVQPISLDNVLVASFDQLGREQRGRFLAMAVLANGVTASKEMLGHLWAQDLADARVAVKDLRTRSMVEVRGHEYIVHDLLLDFVRSKIKEDDSAKETFTRRQAQYLGSVEVFMAYSDRGEIHRGFHSLLALWHSLKDLSCDDRLDVSTYTTTLSELEQRGATWKTAHTFGAVARLFDLQGQLDEAQRLYKKALAISEQVHGPSHPEVVLDISNLAVLLRVQSNLDEADRLSARALAMGEEIFEPDHPDLSVLINNRAAVLTALAIYDDADVLLLRAIEIAEKLFGSDHSVFAQRLHNRACLLQEQGKYAEAEPLCAQAKDIWEKILGPEHPSVATALTTQAHIFSMQGKYKDAGALYERALGIDERVYGSTHVKVAKDLLYRAGFLQDQGKNAEAGLLYPRAIAILEKNLGPEHLTVATAVNNWAQFLKSQGKYNEADSLYVRAISIGERHLGSAHPDLAVWLGNRAALLQAQRKFADAEPLQARSQAILEKVHGRDHPYVATALNNRAAMLIEQGKYSEAELMYTSTQDIFEKLFGREHPNVVTVLGNRAGLFEAQGRDAEAESLYNEAIALGEKALGPEHPTLAVMLDNLAVLLSSQGGDTTGQVRCQDFKPPIAESIDKLKANCVSPWAYTVVKQRYAEAETIYARIQAIYEKCRGHRHPTVGAVVSNRAQLLEAQGKIDDAETLYKEAVAIDEETYGFSHPVVATNLINRARLLCRKGKHDEAEPMLERALGIIKEKLGENDDIIASTARLLQKAREAQVRG